MHWFHGHGRSRKTIMSSSDLHLWLCHVLVTILLHQESNGVMILQIAPNFTVPVPVQNLNFKHKLHAWAVAAQVAVNAAGWQWQVTFTVTKLRQCWNFIEFFCVRIQAYNEKKSSKWFYIVFTTSKNNIKPLRWFFSL